MTSQQWPEIPGSMQGMLPAMSLAAVIGGGIMLFLWGIRMSASLPARRLALMQGETGLALRNSARYSPDWNEASAGWYASGLSNEERWQIVRSLAMLHVPVSSSLAVFAAMRFCLAVGGGAIAYFATPSAAPFLPLIAGAASAIAGWVLPIFGIGLQLRQHRKSVGTGLPDALELLAICVGAGLSLEGALQRVSFELKLTSPALSDELAFTWAEISISPSRDKALTNLADRVDIPAVRSVIGTLSQSLRFGTPLARSLRTAANEMRNQQMIELEERANRLPALMTVPVMLFIMPSIFLIVGGPAAIKLVDMFR
ncbi:MAG: type II secretion system F family protein [Rhodomicrobium sp.]